MFQGNAKVSCFLDVADGVVMESVGAQIPLVLPLPSKAQALAFFRVELHLPLFLPFGKAVYVLLQTLFILVTGDGAVAEGIIREEAGGGCQIFRQIIYIQKK